jgi:hypothetical protein
MGWFSKKPPIEEIVRREVRAAVAEAIAPFEQLIIKTAAAYVETVTPGKGRALDDIELAFASPPEPETVDGE